MANFTPGPWFAGEDGQIWRQHPSTLYENGGGTAGEFPLAVSLSGPEWWENRFPAQANARLIAAAPALYEAVEALVECFIKRGPFDEPLGSSEQAPSINAGIAALALARSEAAAVGGR